ncbi:NADP-dependent oxidoreductase [uncultured Paracoccus sp.]|uniref:NADP-dependent oxidoreductase n=1 Tax=uncultured Paracoccus sp. TaxID=189685 RepID=UPI002626EA1C|nr:NADP-dependent oxidoreductase [uncultured Paracoccus sp.]
MTRTRQIVLASRPQGSATRDNFRLEQVDLPQPGPGEVAVRLIWMSLDPYMRGRMDAARSYAPAVEVDAPMQAGAVAQVTASNSDRFAVGDIVVGNMPWSEAAVVPADGLRRVDPAHGPIQHALSVLGMPGMTAWVGLTRIAPTKPGDTVLVSAATGAVGSVAGQIARSRGLRVIGVAGGPEKCRYAEQELGYDACLDHRAGDADALSAAIQAAAPDGVDVYFENVGGKTLQAVLPHMNDFGRIAVCGAIAWYDGKNLDQAPPLPAVWVQILRRRLNVRGFIVFDHADAQGEFVAEVAPLVASGAITIRETVADGLDAAPEAFLGLLRGENFGKQLVRVGPDPQ